MTLHAVWHFTAKMMKRCSCIFSLMSIMLFRNTQRHIILFSLKKAMTSDESIKSHSNVAETILHLQSCSKLVCSLGWSSLCQILLSISILFAVFWSDEMPRLKKLLLFTRVWYMPVSEYYYHMALLNCFTLTVCCSSVKRCAQSCSLLQGKEMIFLHLFPPVNL